MLGCKNYVSSLRRVKAELESIDLEVSYMIGYLDLISSAALLPACSGMPMQKQRKQRG